MNFHKFYNAVDEAKLRYLRNAVKVEVPTFIEINCDSYRCDDDDAVGKIEPMDAVVVKVEVDVEPFTTEDMTTEKCSTQNHNDFQNVTNDSNDGNENDVNADDELIPENVDALSVTVEIVGTGKNDTKTKTINLDRKKCVDEHLESMVSNYMDMACEICEYPFDSLATANGHYRKEHNKRGIIVKCCQKRVDLYDIFEHIQYHLDPDIFK